MKLLASLRFTTYFRLHSRPAGSPPQNLASTRTSNALNFQEGTPYRYAQPPDDEIIFAFHYSLALGRTLSCASFPTIESSRVENNPPLSLLSLYSTVGICLACTGTMYHVCMFFMCVRMYVPTPRPYITYICTVMRMKKRACLPDKRGLMHSF